MINSLRKSRQSKTEQNSTRKLDSSLKNKERNDSKLNFEKINRQHEQITNDNKLKKLDSDIDNCQKEIRETINKLNDEEEKIYEIQKRNLDNFKEEIIKYQNIYNELKNKSEKIENQLIKSEEIEILLYNQTFMLKEDYLSCNNELNELRDEVEENLENLKQLEKDYPKEYKFIQEDFQLENKLKDLILKVNNNNNRIKYMKKENTVLEDNREQLLKQIVIIQNNDNSNREINKLESDLKLKNLENEITKNISDLLIWNNLKDIIKNFFGNSPQQNDKLIKSLQDNLNIVKEELNDFKKEKIIEKGIIDEEIENITNKKNKKLLSRDEQNKDNNNLLNLQEESSKIISILQEIEKDEKELETLFHKYIYLIKNKNSNEDNNFELRFKNEIINLMTKDSHLTIEELKEISNLIEEYFKELNIKEKKISKFKELSFNTGNQLNSINQDIDLINEKILNNENDIKEKKEENIKLKNEIKEVKETMSIRDKNLRVNLQTLGDVQFKSYLENNEETLKNMKKIYGTKICDKVFKVQKEKFLENVILDHSYKKSKLNEYVSFINSYNDKCEFYKNEMNNLDNIYNNLLQKFQLCLNFIDEKKKEKKILDEAKNDLKNKMQFTLDDQDKEIKKEKEKLQKEHGVNFYIQKIKELNNQLNILNEKKDLILQNNEKLKKDYNDLNIQYLNTPNMNLTDNKSKLNNSENTNENNNNNILRAKNKSQPKKKYNLISVNETIKSTLENFNKLGGVELHKEKKNLNSHYETNTNLNNINNLNDISIPNKNSTLIQKIRPLINGLNIYKRFDNVNLTLLHRKNFNPLKADKFPPDECGYILRIFKLNPKKETLEIKKPEQKSNNHFEMSISIFDIEDIFLGEYASKLLKVKEKKITKLDRESKFLLKYDFVSFTLVTTHKKIDLIAPNYISFINFDAAIKAIIRNPNLIFETCKFIN